MFIMSIKERNYMNACPNAKKCPVTSILCNPGHISKC